MLVFLSGTGCWREKKAAPFGAAPVASVKVGYGTVTVSCVLWTVLPETAVMVKV
jgi:hypothetical protein